MMGLKLKATVHSQLQIITKVTKATKLFVWLEVDSIPRCRFPFNALLEAPSQKPLEAERFAALSPGVAWSCERLCADNHVPGSSEPEL